MEVIECCKKKAPEILDHMTAEFSAGQGEPGHHIAVQIKSALQDLKCNLDESSFLSRTLSIISDIMSSKAGSKAMPSAFRFLLQCELSAIYSNQEKRDELFDAFKEVTTAPPAIAWNIIFSFLKKMMDVAFIAICEKIRGPILQSTKWASKDDFNHNISQQVICLIFCCKN